MGGCYGGLLGWLLWVVADWCLQSDVVSGPRLRRCNNLVSTGSYAALEGKIFCKPHFMQLFKLKGNYNEGFGAVQHKHRWNQSTVPGQQAAQREVHYAQMEPARLLSPQISDV